MKQEIRIYIEGAAKGDQAAALRKGFRKFLDSLYQLAQQNNFKFHPPVMCGSGENAYKEFKVALRANPDAIIFLLVDAEGAITEADGPWAQKRWDPLGLDDERCHLMVEVMEAWLIADKAALQQFYGRDFSMNALPSNPQVEQIPKRDLIEGLKNATTNTKKGRYHKTRHAPAILASLNVDTVRRVAPNCNRLFETISAMMN